jgi:hypothetical protein
LRRCGQQHHGEHGVGLEKRLHRGFDGRSAAMAQLKVAFNAGEQYNPGESVPGRRVAANDARMQLAAALGTCVC